MIPITVPYREPESKQMLEHGRNGRVWAAGLLAVHA